MLKLERDAETCYVYNIEKEMCILSRVLSLERVESFESLDSGVSHSIPQVLATTHKKTNYVHNQGKRKVLSVIISKRCTLILSMLREQDLNDSLATPPEYS